MPFKASEIQKPKGYFAVLSETYQDFANNTSIHGLKYTVSTKVGTYEKVFWTIVTTFGLCGAVYMTLLFWERYTSNPTRTTVFTAYASTTEIPFPAVTICNLNSIMTRRVDKFMKKLEYNATEESIIRNAIPQLLSFTSSLQVNTTELDILQNALEQNGYSDTTVVMEEISQSCQDMLVHCVWDTRKISCVEHFEKSFSHFGTCCSFNFKNGKIRPNLYSQYSGVGTGLRVLLNSQPEAHYSRIYSSGFKVNIHYPSVYPGPQTDSRIATDGKISYIQVVGTKLMCSKGVKDLPINQRQCLYPDEFHLRYFGNKYNEANCRTECEENLYYRLCDCVPFYFSFSDKPTCNISKILCLQQVKSSHQLHEELEEKCGCIAQCEDISYHLLSTSANMKYRSSFSMMSFANITVHDGYNLLNIFFLNNRQTILMRDTITSTIYLLSSFGGVYSLFMGCSLITIAEIIYYGFFRFLVNLKLFGKINIDVKDTNKPRKRSKRLSFVQKYGNVPFPHIYGNNSY